MSNRAATLRAEETMNNLAGGTLGAAIGFERAFGREFVLGDDDNKRVGAAGLALTIVAVIC